MLKEIKFRVWDILNKKILNWGDIFDLPAWEIFPGTPEQRPFEVMQFTGLCDKNGMEIYEGDICKELYEDGIETGEILQIIWSGYYKFDAKVIIGGTLSEGLSFPLWHWDKRKENRYRQLEIIGNIYENPELLEGEKNASN